MTTSCWREVLCLQRFQIQIDRNQPLLAAIRLGNPDARHADEADADRVQRKVEGLLLDIVLLLIPYWRIGTVEALY